MEERDQFSEEEAARRRDEVIKRMLNTPPQPRRRSSVVHMRLTADASRLLAFVESVDRALQAVHGRVDLPKVPEELVTIKMDAAVASSAGELRVRLDPSEGFLGFVTALRARNADFGAIE